MKPVFGIRWIVTVAAVALITIVVISLGVVHERQMRETLTSELESRILLSARDLALISASALLVDYPELTLNPLLKEMQAKHPETAGTVVVDVSGIIQGHADVRRVGETYVPPAGLHALPRVQGQGEDEFLMGNKEVLVALATVHSPRGQRLGTASVGLKREYISRAIGRARFQQIPILISLLAAGIGCASILMSLLLRPMGALRSGLERIGRGDLDTPIQLRDRTELGLLAEAVNTMAAELKAGQAKALEAERLAHEIELARRIQNMLLPSGRRDFGEVAIEGAYRAATEVGGDYYDVIQIPSGKIGVAIADVAGKGLAGCMVTSMIHALLRTLAEIHDSPAELLAALDSRLGAMLEPGRFVSMFYGVLEPETGKVVYASAGHSPLLIYRRATGAVEWQYSEGIPLCAIRGGAVRKTVRDRTVEVGPGDLLVQYTDGINEATDEFGRQQFGFQNIASVVQTAAHRGTSGVLSDLQQAVERWRKGHPPEDDETLLVIARNGAAAGAGSRIEKGPGNAVEPDQGGVAFLAEARKRGRRLTLTTMETLPRIRDWLRSCPQLGDLPHDQLAALYLALYEASANVAEHAYQEDPDREFELWWVPLRDKRPLDGRREEAERPAEKHAALGDGFFLLRDEGSPYRADDWQRTDFSDREVRRRGRGFGRDIIESIMDVVHYYPATDEGNIVVMSFDQSRSSIESRG